ncbi:MAG: glycosyltransferase [candidate division KSB1 bacterium]|nr:glycosyltransferase [candidate division KSB1 bacterium]MDZ7412373.1 glycosyltransferase [candidate division KSB1 bacterium]
MIGRKKRRLLHVVHGLGRAGGERKLWELLRRIDRQRYEVAICAVGKSGLMEEDFRSLGYELHIFRRRWRYDPTLPFAVARLMRAFRPDVVQTTLFFADIIGALASCLARPRALVSWEVITHPLNLRRELMYWALRRRFDMVVTVSDSIQRFVVEKRHQDPRRITTIHYGVDLEYFRPKSKRGVLAQHIGAPGATLFGTVAHFRRQKGHLYLIEAAARVVASHPEAHFVLVGVGPELEAVKERTRQLSLEGHVHFLGLREDVRDVLNEVDVFVLPSLWEGFPNVVLEAMACGKPVIATAVEGTAELVVHGETGLLVKPAHAEELAGALLAVLNDHDAIAEFGAAGRRRVEEHFSVEHQVAAFEQLYEALADGRPELVPRRNALQGAAEVSRYSHLCGD